VCGKIKAAKAIREAAINRSGTLAIENPDLAKEWVAPLHRELYELTPHSVSPNSNLWVYWRCLEHGQWPARVGRRVAGDGCPKCMASKGERAVATYLKKNGYRFESEYLIGRLTKSHVVDGFDLSRRKADFAVFSRESDSYPAALIEFQGAHHYRPVSFFGGLTEEEAEKKFEMQVARDRALRKFSSREDFVLLEIPYWNLKWVNEILQDFFKSPRLI
jgi:hypothetical protein